MAAGAAVAALPLVVLVALEVVVLALLLAFLSMVR
jgi:hypothetical protein